ncbi:MAG TPA: hypothetical protein VGI70_10920, partial [Polyangiales bacterium]
MPVRFVLVVTVALASLSSYATAARADQRRDFMLSGSEPGDHMVLDYFGTGGQLTLEHRRPIYGGSNDYSANVAVLTGYPLAQVTASTTLRVLFFELGATAGYRSVWRNLSFEPGDDSYCKDCDRAARRKLDPILGGKPDSDRYGFAEASIQLYAPFNEYFMFTSLLATRYEGSRPRSY